MTAVLTKDQIAALLTALSAPTQTTPVVDLRRLAEPFPAAAVSWRVGSTNSEKTKGMALAYIDARDVMDRLDDVVGAGNWRDEYQELGGFFLCKLWLRVDGEWVWKTDGAGKTDVEGEKGMVSDAFKRAAVKWGVGRYLYSLASPWVPIEARGKSYFIPDSSKTILLNVLMKQAREAYPNQEGGQPERPPAAAPIDQIPHAEPPPAGFVTPAGNTVYSPNPAYVAAVEAKKVTEAARQDGAATATVAKMAAKAAAPSARWQDGERAKMRNRIDAQASAALRNTALASLNEVSTLGELNAWVEQRQKDNTRGRLIAGDANSLDVAFDNKEKMLKLSLKGLPAKASAGSHRPGVDDPPPHDEDGVVLEGAAQ